MPAPSPVEISLTDQTGRTLRVVGRAAVLLELVLLKADKINTSETGNITRILGKVFEDFELLDAIKTGHTRFDFAPNGMTYEAMKVERR